MIKLDLLLTDVKKSFNSQTVLKGVNLEIKTHEFICILGHSGCGKSTMLNLIAGFTQPDEGSIRVDEKAIKGPSKERGVVFQEHALFPWLTVLENIAFGPEVQGKEKDISLQLASKYLKMIGLEKYAHYYPDELSGGMKQRVGIARALAAEPKILLMDEPFAALDVFTKETMRRELIDIWEQLKTTIIFITHDVAEAVYLADRVIVMKNGVIEEDVQVTLLRPRSTTQYGFNELVNRLSKKLGH